MNSPVLPVEANDILRRLFVGAVVNGVRFGLLQLLFDNQSAVGEPYLNLASQWRVFDLMETLTSSFPGAGALSKRSS
ncbi:MAG: hypothetical protein IPP88_12240 [Betaproteobacteria bacterium]|nr:hypothetical protein [Betaproteobacteria bacterium]